MANTFRTGGKRTLKVFDKYLHNSVMETFNNAQIVNGLLNCYGNSNLLSTMYVNAGQSVCVKFSTISKNIISGYVGIGSATTWGVYTTLPSEVAGLTFKSPPATTLSKIKIDIVHTTGNSTYIEKIWIE